MSKVAVQRKPTIKKNLDRDLTVVDEETNRRRLCYQLLQKDKQRKSIAMDDNRKMNEDQIEILREILFNHRDINDLIKAKRANKFISKANNIHNGKSHYDKTTKISTAKIINSSDVRDVNQSKDNHSDEEVVETGQNRFSRSYKKEQQSNPMTRSLSLYSQSRLPSNGVRTTNNVSFVPDQLKNDERSTNTESNTNPSSEKIKKLLDHLSSELNDLESMTGSKSNTNVSASHTCSVALATALITLTGYVKQCVQHSKENQEINNLKEEVSAMVRNQMDFQKKMESQILTLQTMMQTICQLINTEIVSSKKYDNKYLLKTSHRDDTNFEVSRSNENWLTNAQRPYLIPKDTDNAMNELLLLTRRMDNPTPLETDLYHQNASNSSINRHSGYLENLEASKKRIESSSSMSANEMNSNDVSKQAPQYKTFDQDIHSSTNSPIELPSSYDMFESGLPNRVPSASRHRNSSHGSDTMSMNVPAASMNETLLEKILHERLRLVQQMAELSKQHEMTQEELAHLEAKNMQSDTK